ncbi:uncharacterized protein LOC115874994 [Sitophilus oryzae]|uniref:Uncharacterized protein LOC115874994 n=1 Tax=Sitophilus oryzae TaxID=7048 RepID=A0A6J2X4Q2_SITOR|nr:uncharacterized protein LOC115874994 [Sitophilus oryzae]
MVAVHVQIPAGRRGGGMEFVACSAYFPGDKTADLPPPKKVRELISFCKRKNLQLVIGCDANGHNEAWGSTDTNFRGELILHYLIGEGLVVNNIGSEPTFVTCNRKEVLDITVSSNYLSNRISNWRVKERTLLQYRDPKCTDWEGYNRSLVHLLEPTIAKVRDRDEIDIAAEQLRCAIITAYSENCPLKTKKDNRKSSWWNNKLDKRRKEVRQLFNRAKVSGNWETYRTTLAEYNKEIRRAKRESWRRFCGSLVDLPQSTRIHKILSKEPVNELGTIQRPDGNFTESRKETLEILAQKHFPGCLILGDEERPPPILMSRRNRPKKEDWEMAKKVITYRETKGAIESFDPFKSPGEDGCSRPYCRRLRALSSLA